MKYLVITFTFLVLAFGGYVISTTKADEGFTLSGRVDVAERLRKPAQADNVSCSIVVKNEADVPIAIKRIINPKFPMNFNIGKEDLLIDDVEGNIKLEVQINSHGNLGVLKSGDIFGESKELYASGRKDIVLVADKMMGKPTLGSNRGNFFRTAAR
ncbi:hypothetical protein [Candidatus Proelusimicrobium volucris]|uniref:hypothetical protein n=1 Tax=Candidatus Proelusimicrobium volucris TaxID=3416225 RepID=UPI003D0DBCF8